MYGLGYWVRVWWSLWLISCVALDKVTTCDSVYSSVKGNTNNSATVLVIYKMMSITHLHQFKTQHSGHRAASLGTLILDLEWEAVSRLILQVLHPAESPQTAPHSPQQYLAQTLSI